MRCWHPRAEIIPREQAAIVGANIRALRQSKGWPQRRVGELMGWISNSTVCAAEGHRDGRQRDFTTEEVRRLASIFGVEPWQITTRCVNCKGRPPAGFACLTCGAQSLRLPSGIASYYVDFIGEIADGRGLRGQPPQ
jgi:transcriptional regulator with XRE-family HTH domain